MMNVLKRDKRVVEFDPQKITIAIKKGLLATQELISSNEDIDKTARMLTESIIEKVNKKDQISVEEIQDIVETTLMESHYTKTAKSYILYRQERTNIRDKNSRLMATLDQIIQLDSKESDLKRENGNINGDTAMGNMLRIGSETSKEYYKLKMLNPVHSEAHGNGDIHIADLDFYNFTLTCCQIDLTKLFKNGFNTGHGQLREPNDIMSYGSLSAIAIQANQNEMHGGVRHVA